jgi:multidrug efflux pump subunit AcrA (membrane-fusion protein)
MTQITEDLDSRQDAEAWRALAQAETAGQLFDAWLAVLCRALSNARAGLVLLAQPDGSFAPTATLPAARDLSYLSEIATEALRQREGVVRHDEFGHARLAYPLLLQEQLRGAVVLDLGNAPKPALERALRLTHWGAGWLLELLQQQELQQQRERQSQGRFLLDTLLALMGERSLREAALALVNRVGREFDCHQVQLGIAQGKTLKLLAQSHAAWFDERAGVVNLALQAMHEAFDQRQRVLWPAPEGDALLVAGAHRRYADEAGAAALCSLPLGDTHGQVGVLLLERDRPFGVEEQDVLQTLALALAPALQLKREAEQGAAARVLRTGRRWLGLATDSSHPAWKLGLGTAAALLVLLAVVPAPFRVSAQALVEGAVQRAAVAPFEGYLREAPARAGDSVQAGQVLAVLDDKDLRLERVRWESELALAQQKEREAMAKANRVDQAQAAAQANQARAQLDLVLGKLERVNVVAPFDGVVVKGDLSQQLGSPLEQGKVLFELAPLDAWRVILKVDERDIGHVRPEAAGELVLSSLPGRSWPFKVKKLTPIAVAEDGRNYFRVEAELGEAAPKLSPNMEGVAKVDAGRASLLWAWTRPMVDWARLTWWKVMP